MAKDLTFPERLSAVERTRPVFRRERYTDDGSFPYTCVLAKMSDIGHLEVNGVIYMSEMADFAKWIKDTWK